MSLLSMQAELRGSVPKIPYAYTKTLIQRAWRDVREANLWSFNLLESAFASPAVVTTGTVTLVQGTPNVTFDVTAIAALNASQLALPTSLITQRQLRTAIGGLYNIITMNFGTGAATLDRPFMDVGGAGLNYQVYQAYYPAPVQDFLGFLSVRNQNMFIDLDLDTTRAQIDAWDPQRSWYQFPTRMVPFATDTRPGSATLNYRLFELWGQAVAPFTYQCYSMRSGVPLVNPGDTLPPNIDEELVVARARVRAYEWAEANKDMVPRSTGPDFKFLMGQAESIYKDLLIKYRRQDREFIDNWRVVLGPTLYARGMGYYNTITGTAGPYFQ